MIGHENIISDLKNLTSQGHLAHAYIFFGPEEVGKKTLALELADFLERKEWPVGKNPHPLVDALLVSPDEAGTIGIDRAREIKEFLSQSPFSSVRRTVIVDNAEALTTEAENALLKTAEEPPASSLLILIVRDPEVLMPTLISRFQKFYLGGVPKAAIAKWLKEEHGIKQPEKFAEVSGGKPGLALKLAEGNDEIEKEAKRFLTVPPAGRRDYLKALLEPEDFNYKKFLEALINVLARDPKRNSALWHAVVELRSIADSTGLNPRIQLTNLWTLI